MLLKKAIVSALVVATVVPTLLMADTSKVSSTIKDNNVNVGRIIQPGHYPHHHHK